MLYSNYKKRERLLSGIVTANIVVNLLSCALELFNLIDLSPLLPVALTFATWTISGVVLVPTIADMVREPGGADRLLGIGAAAVYLLAEVMMVVDLLLVYGVDLGALALRDATSYRIVELALVFAVCLFIELELSRARRREGA